VGVWRPSPRLGDIVTPGTTLGELEILGVLHRLEVPASAGGTVVSLSADRARYPVGYGDLLVVLDPSSRAGTVATEASAASPASAGSLLVRASSSGRIYLSSGPGKPAFVKVGDHLSAGQVVCLLEVMKTFNRVHYGGDGLPERAVVVAVLRADEDEVHAGDPLFEVAPEGHGIA
ncbi:MAG TPA: biotin/lipoyl-containing protein, partial [Kofleriaceae bacterium]|nr:biotin/lipoyl-containing protein [Kofleriaceae bacterium]